MRPAPGLTGGVRAHGRLFARAALAAGAPLLGFTLAGHPALAAAGGSTALLVTLAEVGERPARRMAAMAATLAAIAAGCAFVARVGSGSVADHALVVACAFAAALLSGRAPGLAAAARFAAMTALSAVGLHADHPGALAAVLAGGAWAIALAWSGSRLWPDEAGPRPGGADRGAPPPAGVTADWRYAACAAAAALASIALGPVLQVTRAYWATLTVVMVMQREGPAGWRLPLHYAAGTLPGVLAAELLWKATGTPLGVALAATVAAALTRVGAGLTPAAGVAGFTTFVMLIIDLSHRPFADPTPLMAARLVDVSVGGLLALLATGLADAWRRRARAGHDS